MKTLLKVENRSIRLPEGADRPYAIRDVSYALKPGEILCVVGESGSGKSMTANAIMGLLPKSIEVEKGAVTFEGYDLVPGARLQSQGRCHRRPLPAPGRPGQQSGAGDERQPPRYAADRRQVRRYLRLHGGPRGAALPARA